MIYLILLVLVLGYLVAERRLHERRLRRIPVRIHVNGTRGKTAVTRLAAELLRQAGVRTLAKTTGDRPVVHMPDGGELPLPRCGPARIQEQMSVVRLAARAGVDAVVVECMALDPHLQEISATAMLRATVGAITNVRPDHFEVMGPSLAEAAGAMARTAPAGGVLVCGADCPLTALRAAAVRHAVSLVPAEPLPSLADPVLAENLALAAEIVLQAGAPPGRVEAGVQRIVARGSNGLVRRLGTGDREVALVDAFSANDTVSTDRLREWAVRTHGAELPRPWVALLNARSDRPLRTVAFAESLARASGYDALAVTGSGGLLARHRLKRDRPTVPVFAVAGRDPLRLLDAVAAGVAAQSFTLFGIGNHRGAGAALRRHFAGGVPCS
jgi:poly-gamma-glutamate synthase PgsB/CapB